MMEHPIERARDPVSLCEPTADVREATEPLEIRERPWSGQETDPGHRIDDHLIGATARLLYDDRALYLRYDVTDCHQQASTTRLNGRVWTDSCVELFAAPGLEEPGRYLNFEANCTGQFLLGWGTADGDRRRISRDLAGRIRVETSVDAGRKEPSPDDDRWWLTATIPFEVLREFTGREVARGKGTVWWGNLQCCRGEPAPAYAMWRPSGTPEPEFHRPEGFGRVRFR